MNRIRFFLGGDSPTIPYTRAYLQARGCAIAEKPDEAVTHVLFPVPSGHCTIPEEIPADAVILDGETFLQDSRYLAANAAITADCAIQLAMEELPRTLGGIQVLILGWGRIAKCLAQKLMGLGANVTVWARKETDLATAESLGCRAAAACDLHIGLLRYRLIFNTVPAMLLRKEQMIHCRPDCVKIDLASERGMEGDDVIWARGLPRKLAPETSGQLIGAAAMRFALKKE